MLQALEVSCRADLVVERQRCLSYVRRLLQTCSSFYPAKRSLADQPPLPGAWCYPAKPGAPREGVYSPNLVEDKFSDVRLLDAGHEVGIDVFPIAESPASVCAFYLAAKLLIESYPAGVVGVDL
jgi:hypothetical protein